MVHGGGGGGLNQDEMGGGGQSLPLLSPPVSQLVSTMICYTWFELKALIGACRCLFLGRGSAISQLHHTWVLFSGGGLEEMFCLS